jgi:TolB protein
MLFSFNTYKSNIFDIHIFYKQSQDGNTGTGYIIDRFGKNKVKVSEPDMIFAFSTEGRWVDNDRIIFSTLDQQMYIADINGSVNKVEPDSDIVYSLKKKLGDQAVEWVIPSPSENKFAIVRKITQTKRELFITDSKGRKAVTLAKGTQIFGSSWSPNSDTLAFSVISEDKGERGLFVVDVKSKKITQLSTDLDEVSGPITWSPSGNKLLVSKVIVKNNKNEFVAYVLTLKK